MSVNVNGEARDDLSGCSVVELVERLGVPAGGRGVAVAIDGEVVRRGAWETTAVPDGAAVEIVTAVQGG